MNCFVLVPGEQTGESVEAITVEVMRYPRNLLIAAAGDHGVQQTETTETLVPDLVEWAARPRPFDEVMEAWRTSCPRLTIWEDAVDRGLVVCEQAQGASTVVRVTPLGRDFLRDEGRLPAAT